MRVWPRAAAIQNFKDLCGPKLFRAAIPPIVPFRVRTSHNNTIRTVKRSLPAADTDGYANAKSGTTRKCAGKSSGKVWRDTSTSDSQSLSGRSLGGLDGAAALPAATACGEQSYRFPEGKREVLFGSKSSLRRIVAALRTPPFAHWLSVSL